MNHLTTYGLEQPLYFPHQKLGGSDGQEHQMNSKTIDANFRNSDVDSECIFIGVLIAVLVVAIIARNVLPMRKNGG